jgi:magnesium-transporting ATPase (P-type)
MGFDMASDADFPTSTLQELQGNFNLLAWTKYIYSFLASFFFQQFVLFRFRYILWWCVVRKIIVMDFTIHITLFFHKIKEKNIQALH